MSSIDDLLAEIARIDGVHPGGFPANRDGLRLCMAAVQDELDEARDAWREARCKCLTPRCSHADWHQVAGELLQVAAVAMRGVRSIMGEGTDEREG